MNEDMILAVKSGAYFLDENYPGWAAKIDFDRFEMDNCQRCIVGQAIGDYGLAIAKACGGEVYGHESNEWAVEHGFDVTMQAYDESECGLEAYSELETLWTDQVRDRLGRDDNHR